MAGYYKQQRSLPLVSIEEQFGDDPKIVTVLPAAQTTYSYRSSQPTEALEQTLADLLRPGKWSPFLLESDNGHEFYTKKASAFFGERGRYDPLSRSTTLKPVARYSPGYRRLLTTSNLTKAEAVFLQPALMEKLLYPSLMSDNDKSFYGKKLIVAAAPNRPEASLTTFFAEFLRDGLPSLMLSSIGSGRFKGIVKEAKGLGGDYLNVQFGWAPLIRDFVSLLNVVQNSYKIVEQYRRDSGVKGVRRRRTINVDTVQRSFTTDFGINNSSFGNGISSSFTTGDPGYDPYGYAYRNSVNSVQLTETQKVTFAGKFQYYINKSDELSGRLERYASYANKLVGVKITPEVLWNAAPWTWLLDWFADVGTSVEVATMFQTDDLVIRYGYLMRETTKRFLFNLEEGSGSQYPTPALTSAIIGTTKERYRATPYGFGWDPGTASDSQLLITAALLSGDRTTRGR